MRSKSEVSRDGFRQLTGKPSYEVGAVVSDVSVDIDSVRVGYACVPCGSADYLLIPAASFVGTLDVTGSIPGVHESPMNLLLDDDGRRDAYLTIDLKTASALK